VNRVTDNDRVGTPEIRETRLRQPSRATVTWVALIAVVALIALVGFGALIVHDRFAGPAPGTTCEPPSKTPIIDHEHGFTICLPGHWRELRAGDPGWAVIYDEPNSQPEQDVADGTITHFAVPLSPRDADTAVNLAIYVRPNESRASNTEIGEHYAQQIRDRGDTRVAYSLVTLPVGEVVEVTATVKNDISDVPSLDWLDGFVIPTPESLYYVLFRCSIEWGGTYDGQFEGIVRSFGLLPVPASSVGQSGNGTG
jgi:hypothetical protein